MKKKHKTKITSILAYCDVLENLGERQTQVYRKLLELKVANNRMISEELDLPINEITPRINELRKLQVVLQAKKDLCPHTQKMTLFWRVRRKL